MKVRDLMTTEVHSCSSGDTADKAASLMWAHDIGFVPVVDAEYGILGVVTDRDLLMASHLRGQRLAEIPVGSVMGPRAHTCGPNDSLAHAEQIMAAHQVRRLVVAVDGKLVGVLSTNDLVRAAGTGWRQYKQVGLVQALAAIAAPRKAARPTDTIGEPVMGFDALRQARDELRLQIHLAKADAQEEWEKAEAKWFRMQSSLSIAEEGASHAAKDATAAWKQLMKEIGDGYARVRQSLHDA
jgi:CBS domain-containing protein